MLRVLYVRRRRGGKEHLTRWIDVIRSPSHARRRPSRQSHQPSPTLDEKKTIDIFIDALFSTSKRGGNTINLFSPMTLNICIQNRDYNKGTLQPLSSRKSCRYIPQRILDVFKYSSKTIREGSNHEIRTLHQWLSHMREDIYVKFGLPASLTLSTTL